MLSIEDSVCELPYPVAEYHHSVLSCEHKVEFYVAMSEDEEVDVG